MNTNQFTQKTIEALQSAQRLAVEYANPAIEQEHLLCALAGQNEGLIPQLLTAAGADPGAFVQAATEKVAALSRVTGSGRDPDKVYISSELDRALNAAEAQAEIDKFNDNFDKILKAIQDIDISEVGSRGQALIDQGESLAADPERVVHMLLSYGTDTVMGLGLQEVARAMMERYLANGNLGGSAYLQSPGVFSSKPDPVMDGVRDLVFFVADLSGGNDSTFLSSEGNVKLVVEYNMNYVFGVLPLPFRNGLNFHQEVATKMWLGGSGDGYKG